MNDERKLTTLVLTCFTQRPIFLIFKIEKNLCTEFSLSRGIVLFRLLIQVLKLLFFQEITSSNCHKGKHFGDDGLSVCSLPCLLRILSVTHKWTTLSTGLVIQVIGYGYLHSIR